MRKTRSPRPAGGRPGRRLGKHKGIDWQALTATDWALENAELGRRLGVSPSFVSRQRRRHGHPLPAPSQPTITVDQLFEMAAARRRLRGMVEVESITRADVRACLGSDRKARWWLNRQLDEGGIYAVGQTRGRKYFKTR